MGKRFGSKLMNTISPFKLQNIPPFARRLMGLDTAAPFISNSADLRNP
jgi:hypothetical protein